MAQSLASSGVHLDPVRLADLCRRFGVRELSVFGSAARNELRPDSDLDLLVEFQPGARIGIFKFGALTRELQTLAGRPIDLVTKTGLKPWIRDRVLLEARTLYAA
jgi:uncharacterized protein